MNWLGWLFCRRPRQPAPEAIMARDLAERIGRRSEEISAQLRLYQRARDPFAAFMADMYNRDQLTRMHRGNQQ